MDNRIAIIIAAGIILLFIIMTATRYRYQQIIKKKNRKIVRYMCEEVRLSKELERTRIEKDVLEKVFKECYREVDSQLSEK